jgi:hypothetical protein
VREVFPIELVILTSFPYRIGDSNKLFTGHLWQNPNCNKGSQKVTQ